MKHVTESEAFKVWEPLHQIYIYIKMKKPSYPTYAKDTCYHVSDALRLFRHTVKRSEFFPKIVEISVVTWKIQIFGACLRMETLSKR
jgi:hypothetical protein